MLLLKKQKKERRKVGGKGGMHKPNLIIQALLGGQLGSWETYKMGGFDVAFNTAPEIIFKFRVFFCLPAGDFQHPGTCTGEPTKRRADTDTLWVSVLPVKDSLSSASLRGPGSITVDCASVNLLAQLEQSSLS